jgi:signal peptidase I
MLSGLRSLPRPLGPGLVLPRRISSLLGGGALLIAAALASPVHPAIVSGESMTPALQPGQVVLCSRDGGSGELKRGDVVLLRRHGQVYIKRIFAMGGERFWQTSGFGGAKPSVSGSYPSLLTVGTSIRAWQRRYPRFRFDPVTVPRDSVYVVGDGNSSEDSRVWGAVPKEQLLGHVVFPTLTRMPSGREPAVFTALPRRPLLAPRS